MPIWVFPSAKAVPPAARRLEDTDEIWRDLLVPDNLEVLDRARKHHSLAVCGAEFAPGATTKDETAENILAVHALVLDVDNWGVTGGTGPAVPLTWEVLQERLAGTRAVIWTTWSSTARLPKYRLVLPLAVPLPTSKYRPLCRRVNRLLGGAIAESTFDCGRLGFFASVESPEGRADYRWAICPGERLDWTPLLLEDEPLGEAKPLFQPPEQRPANWTSDAEALSAAKRYFAKVGQGTPPGGRHEKLLQVACQLWWEWAAPHEDFVREVLEQVNTQFLEPKTPDEIQREVVEGHARTVGDRPKAQDQPYGVRREPTVRLNRHMLRELAKRIRKRDPVAGEVLTRVADQAGIGDPAEARAMLFTALEAIARELPREDPAHILSLFQHSLGAQRMRQTPQNPLPTDEECLAKLRGVQLGAQRLLAEREAARNDVEKRRIIAAFEAVGEARDTPYTAAELHVFEQRGHRMDRWVVQHGASFYFFVQGRYLGPYGRDSADNAALILLAPAGGVVRTSVSTKEGVRPLTAKELVREGYGVVVSAVAASLSDEDRVVSESGGKLVRSLNLLRDIPAVAHADVDQWLRLLVGTPTNYDALLRWLALMPDHRSPAPLLVIEGPSGVGKNLLACGIARLWGARPSKADAALDHTDLLETCPFVHFDEKLPRKMDSETLRELVTQESRAVKRVYNDRHTLDGYLRFMLSCNDMRRALRNVMQDSTPAALFSRLVVIKVQDDAAKKYLDGLGLARREAWVEGDVLAQHIMYLHQAVGRDGSQRLGMAPGDVTWQQGVVGGTSMSLQWTAQYLSTGRFMVPAVVWHEGNFWVQPQLIADLWKTTDGLTRVDLNDVFMDLARSTGDPMRIGLAGYPGRKRYRKVETAALQAAFEDYQGDSDVLETAAAGLTRKFTVTSFSK